MYRKRNRIQGYDYSEPNVYLITICTANREHLFGFVSTRGEAPVTVLSPLGELVERAILGIPTHYTNAFLETYSILPNHIHLEDYQADERARHQILWTEPLAKGIPR